MKSTTYTEKEMAMEETAAATAQMKTQTSNPNPEGKEYLMMAGDNR
jgi:hypothetical protein